MSRVTIDTNVFVSALNFGGTPNEILKLLEAGSFTLCISKPIIDEINRVLVRRFAWTEEDVAEALDPILSLATGVEPTMTVNASRDPDDNRILECASESQSDVIVTGDDHLLTLGRFEGILIMTPRDFYESLLRRQ